MTKTKLLVIGCVLVVLLGLSLATVSAQVEKPTPSVPSNPTTQSTPEVVTTEEPSTVFSDISRFGMSIYSDDTSTLFADVTYHVDSVVDASANPEMAAATCGGGVTDLEKPDYVLYVGENEYPAAVYFEAVSASGYTDVAIIVNGPDNRWVCGDGFADASAEFLWYGDPNRGLRAPAGEYDIWIGVFSVLEEDVILSVNVYSPEY